MDIISCAAHNKDNYLWSFLFYGGGLEKKMFGVSQTHTFLFHLGPPVFLCQVPYIAADVFLEVLQATMKRHKPYTARVANTNFPIIVLLLERRTFDRGSSSSFCSTFFCFFGFPPPMWPLRFLIRSFPLRPKWGRCLIMAPPSPLASSPRSTRFRHAEWPPMTTVESVRGESVGCRSKEGSTIVQMSTGRFE